mmetsp:Transcript_14529/g.45667  ORF Transcript_14529/g.45667 Transcript_14529/m.45667 type:complete len:215 (-) Transcript_14529:3376-4020(-)
MRLVVVRLRTSAATIGSMMTPMFASTAASPSAYIRAKFGMALCSPKREQGWPGVSIGRRSPLAMPAAPRTDRYSACRSLPEHPSYGTNMLKESAPPASWNTTIALYGRPCGAIGTGGDRISSARTRWAFVAWYSGAMATSSCARLTASSTPSADSTASTSAIMVVRVCDDSRDAVSSKEMPSTMDSGVAESPSAGWYVSAPLAKSMARLRMWHE